MEIKEAQELIYEYLVGENSIPIELRLNKKLDYNKIEKLYQAIKLAIKFYSDKEEVPKKIACAFIDIYGAFQFKNDFFPKEKLIEYENIGIELQSLALDLLNPKK